MINNKSVMHKLAALILAFIGVAAMVAAWFILLTTASHDAMIVALEVFGVVITLAGYFSGSAAIKPFMMRRRVIKKVMNDSN
jgi:hypothetical protein